MSIELKIPAVGESITEVEIGEWLKAEGDSVQKDENVAVIETEKATVELPAPQAGTLGKILKKKGETVKVGEVVGSIETEMGRESKVESRAPGTESKVLSLESKVGGSPATENLKPKPQNSPLPGGRLAKKETDVSGEPEAKSKVLSLESKADGRAQAASPPSPPSREIPTQNVSRTEETVRMSKLRRTVASRLVEAQHTAALLTTFNEIDMSNVMALRQKHGELFLKRYGTKLGFISFFVKGVIDALKQIPQLNAEIRGEDIIYKNYFDIGVAIGGGKGLVVPVLRNAERLSFSEIELAISDLAKRARENSLKLEELQGGTFTISNGGVYGSLLSTPIINPPQSGVLGMHTIQERPVAREGAVVIRPMMYVALTYDHRIVDGKEAVTFLKRIKDVIENPTRMLIEI
ncbi:MAG: 2-oxoglutarate dehydrogenase complex dihydrolipoyllysine-residue succinyltransferase [Verrucomicrobiota bacterium]|nr:2-oxoglutarate dehydrogenase complex dihydrolipoyllysine-residue succinyltransferase [Verrucomicrobiota bacterium]